MQPADLLAALLSSINKHGGVRIDAKDYDADLTDLGIDSTVAIEIANELEDILGILIDDKDLVHFRTVNQILQYFAKRTA